MNPLTYIDLYRNLTDKQKQELKRTSIGQGSDIIREGLEFYRLFDNPSKAERKATEDFLENLYGAVVGKENVTKVKRGNNFVTTISEPESTAGQITRGIGAFANTLIGVGKITKPIQSFKAIQAATKAAPKTTSIAGTIAKGEVAAQFSLNPYEENLAGVLGSMIADDNDGILGDVEEYLLNPLKPSDEKSELESRVALLADGLVGTGLLVGAFRIGKGAISNRDKISKPFINALKNIQAKGEEASKEFIENIKRVKNAQLEKTSKAQAIKKRQELLVKGETSDLGDIESLSENFLGLKKFSFTKPISRLANFGARTFSSRGGRTKKMFEKHMDAQGIKAKWDKTIENTIGNLDNALQIIYRNTNRSDDKILDDLSELIFSDFRVPGIITSKGVKPPITQRATFLKKLNEFPEEARDAILRARELQDKLSKTLLDSEYISVADKKIIQDQLGFYVRRSYKKFEDPNYMPNVKVTQAAEKFIREDILTKKPNISTSSLDLKVSLEMDKLAGGKGKYANLAKSTNIYSNLNDKILNKKLSVPKVIRDYLGEVTNPLERLTISMSKISNLVTNLDFYNSLYRDGKDIYFHTRPVKGFDVKIPTGKKFKTFKGKEDKSNIKAFGDLSGKYTSPDLLKYFNEKAKYGFALEENGFFQQLYKVLAYTKGWAQKSATVLNHGTHFQNIFGGGHMSLAQGVNIFNKKLIQETTKSLYKNFMKRTDLENQAYVEKLAGLNILNKGPIVRDIKEMMNEVSNIKLWNPFTFITNPISRSNWLAKANKKIEEITDVYIAEDDFYKIIMYEQELKHLKEFNNALPSNYNGLYKFKSTEDLEKEAARLVRGGLPNYDIVPENFLKLRRVPLIGQFFSFLAESTRIGFTTPVQATREISIGNKLIKEGNKKAGNIIKNRGITRMAGYSTVGLGGEAVGYGVRYGLPIGGGVYGVKAINQYIHGVDEQTEKDIKVFLPSYYQNDNIMITVGQNGEPNVHNLSRYDAFDYPRKMTDGIFQTGESLFDDEKNTNRIFLEYATEMLTPFFGEAIVGDTLTDYALSNGKNKNGSLMKNPLDKTKQFDDSGTTSLENILNPDNLKILFMNLAEDMTPGTLKNVSKYLNNYGKDETEFNQDIHEGMAFLKLITGYGTMPMNKEYIEKLYDFKINDFSTSKRKRRSDLFNIARNSKSDEDFMENFKIVQNKYYEDYKDFYNITQAAKRLKISTATVLKDSEKFSALERQSLMFESSAKFKPIKITEGLLDAIRTNKNLSAFNIRIETTKAIRNLSDLPVLNYNSNDVYKKEDRNSKSTGGLVKGEDNVTDTEENPADRTNPYTGESYAETSKGVLATLETRQAERKPLNRGGLLNKLKTRKTYQDGGKADKLDFKKKYNV